jgi:hypothetical protein
MKKECKDCKYSFLSNSWVARAEHLRQCTFPLREWEFCDLERSYNWLSIIIHDIYSSNKVCGKRGRHFKDMRS